jgi:hypothetical protein
LELAERTVEHQPPGDRRLGAGLFARAEISEALMEGGSQIGTVEAMGVPARIEDRLVALTSQRALGVRLRFGVICHRGG